MDAVDQRRSDRGRPARVVLFLVLVLVAAGCGRSQGWQPLWRGEWRQVQAGERWYQGVPAGGRSINATTGQVLRGLLLNTGKGVARVRITGPQLDRTWKLAHRASQAVEETLAGGTYRLQVLRGEVVLCAPRLGRPLAEPRQVVLVLVDALRADHVTRELMPGTLQYFADGRRWGDVSAQAPWTLPSLASLFAARPVLDLTTPEGDVIGVPAGLTSWSEVLAGAGWAGAAVVANYTIHVLNGFGRGFDSYVVPKARGRPPDATDLVREARSWLARHEGENRFLFLHFMEPHGPYRDHQDPEAAVIKPLAYWEIEPSAVERARMLRLYAGEVRYLDRVMAPFLQSLPPSAVVAVTADHGESFGEHGCWAHASCLYQEQMAVPLLIRGAGVLPASEERPAQLVDLTPTLLDLAGVAPAPTMGGRSLLGGGSQLPIISATFTVGPMRWAWRQGRHKVVLHLASQPGLGAPARTRMFEQDRLPTGAFVFDLEQDPAELRPQPLAGPLLAAAGNTFAGSAGRLVPGLQLLVWGARGPVELPIGMHGSLAVVQAWGTSPLRFSQRGNSALLACEDAFPLCAVAGGTGAGAVSQVELLPGTVPWLTPAAGQGQVAVPPEPPVFDHRGGAAVWENPARTLAVDGYQQTMERLRALGYLE